MSNGKIATNTPTQKNKKPNQGGEK